MQKFTVKNKYVWVRDSATGEIEQIPITAFEKLTKKKWSNEVTQGKGVQSISLHDIEITEAAMIKMAQEFDINKVYFAYSNISGWSVFARELIEAYTPISIYPGERLSAKKRKDYHNVNVFKCSDGFFIVPGNKVNVATLMPSLPVYNEDFKKRYCDHGWLKENIFFQNIGIYEPCGSGYIVIIAARNILPNEPLGFNYSITVGNAPWHQMVFFSKKGKEIYAEPYNKINAEIPAIGSNVFLFFGIKPLPREKMIYLRDILNEISANVYLDLGENAEKRQKSFSNYDAKDENDNAKGQIYNLIDTIVAIHEMSLDELSSFPNLAKKLTKIICDIPLLALVEILIKLEQTSYAKFPHTGCVATAPTILSKLRPPVAFICEMYLFCKKDVKLYVSLVENKEKAVNLYNVEKSYSSAGKLIMNVIKELEQQETKLGDISKEFLLVCYSIYVSCLEKQEQISEAKEFCKKAIEKAKQWFKDYDNPPKIIERLQKKHDKNSKDMNCTQSLLGMK